MAIGLLPNTKAAGGYIPKDFGKKLDLQEEASLSDIVFFSKVPNFVLSVAANLEAEKFVFVFFKPFFFLSLFRVNFLGGAENFIFFFNPFYSLSLFLSFLLFSLLSFPSFPLSFLALSLFSENHLQVQR